MGHSLQAVSLLVQAAASVFAVPLAIRIHEGVVWSAVAHRLTLLDEMLALLGIVPHRPSGRFPIAASAASGRARRRVCIKLHLRLVFGTVLSRGL